MARPPIDVPVLSGSVPGTFALGPVPPGTWRFSAEVRLVDAAGRTWRGAELFGVTIVP